jgi:PAS domain S-box-containing protein
MDILKVPRRQQDLHESGELFRILVDGVKDYAIFGLDPTGNVVSWNTGAQHIKGYAASEIIGSHFSRFYTPEDLARNWPSRELELARANGRFEDEGWRVRKDGTRFWANVIITTLYDDERRPIGFAKVTRDLTARRRMEAIEESGRTMTEFLAMLSHELRNPLAAIVNAVELMRIGQERTRAQGQAVIERQVTHLVRIVDDLLDVSRITRGKIALKRAALDLNDVVERVVESCRPAIVARGHTVELQLASRLAPVEADATRLSQVISNLVNNAVKYTPDGGRIAIATGRETYEAVLRVRDNGMGIAPDLLPRIFDPFVQGETPLARTESGLGIGLTLVKRLIELQGGSVEATSAGPGQGSEFVVRLPLARARGASPSPAAKADVPAIGRRRLLVVDDNRDSAEALGALLEAMGQEVRTVNDGAAAIRAADEFDPDAIFLDIGLPGVSGYDVARQFRDTPRFAGVTLIAFTGYGQDEDRRRVRSAGFDHHLLKPTRAPDLARIIEGLPARDAPGPCARPE